MNSAIALTPLQLKSSLDLLEQSPEAQIDLVAQYRKVLDETESEIKLRGLTTEHPSVRRFRHWNPVIIKTLVWNPKKQIHGHPQDILQAAKANLRAVGCIQFFCEGTITVETIQSISPMLIDIVNGAATAKTILSAHCAHLKHRAGINLKDIIIRLKGPELRLDLQEDLRKTYTLPLLKLFWKHLGGAIDITYIYSNEEEPASVWAKAAFVEFLANIADDSLSDYSHLTFVRKALEKGLVSPNLLDIPLARKFACHLLQDAHSWSL